MDSKQILFKRTDENKDKNIPLYEKLAILSRTHHTVKIFCTQYSVAYRISIICELILNDHIKLINNRIYVDANASLLDNNILIEFKNKISLILTKNQNSNFKTIFAILNNEISMKKCNVKILKNRIYKDLKARNIFVGQKGVSLQKTIFLKDNKIWKSLYTKFLEEMVEYNVHRSLSISSIILLFCLNYVNGCESLYAQCNLDEAKFIKNVLSDQMKKHRENKYSSEKERLVFLFLSLMI